MAGPASTFAPPADVRSPGRSRCRRSSSRKGLTARMSHGMKHWPDALEAPISRRRGEIAAVCAGVLAGWVGLIGMGLSILG